MPYPLKAFFDISSNSRINYSRATWAYPMKTKEIDRMPKAFELLKGANSERNEKILTDNGRELRTYRYYLERQGGILIPSAPYSKEQRTIRTTIRTKKDRLNTLRIDAKISIAYWPELLNTVTYLKLRSPATFYKRDSF